ncbi:uncharacterized protein LOC105422679 [Pogonomyrmex barbatus]|uniref:Uncharacterized protein LOC105422679 n=1 Tax=Pogonomyrmex barbatus TaxID=144034 RepID=A0A8N1S2B4_9HYME|nr:uncharacterized protein LOC105422679 [Pogonomyrmex barbatus]
MALTPRCRGGGGGENLSEELANEDEGTNGNNFEPLSDSCGESDMEGLDLSLFEPSVDAASWCDSRVHAGTLHILVHYCEAECCVGEAASEACWEPCYCVLLQDEQTLTAYRSEDMALFAGTACMFKSHNKLGDAMFVELPRVRLDGGARAFRQHWGYETRPLAPPPPLIEEDEAAVEPETVSLREANTASPIGESKSQSLPRGFPPQIIVQQIDDEGESKSRSLPRTARLERDRNVRDYQKNI